MDASSSEDMIVEELKQWADLLHEQLHNPFLSEREKFEVAKTLLMLRGADITEEGGYYADK